MVAHVHRRGHHPTVLCVESEQSQFEVSQCVLRAGAFRVISVTNSAAALRAATALHLDAAVFDCRALNQDAVAAAQRLHDMDPAMPEVLLCPVAGSCDSRGWLDVVVDMHAVVPQLKQALLRRSTGR